MSTEYEWNEAAEIIGGRTIEQHHPHLIGLKIAYLFKQPDTYGNEKAKVKPRRLRGGKKIALAKARLVTRIYSELLRQDFKFLIEFDREMWDLLDLRQRAALVDHELCHCGNDADGIYMKHHDLEEFRGIIERHGLWKSDIEAFAASIEKQKVLALD